MKSLGVEGLREHLGERYAGRGIQRNLPELYSADGTIVVSVHFLGEKDERLLVILWSQGGPFDGIVIDNDRLEPMTDGDMERAVEISGFSALRDELSAATDEQPDVTVSHESDWTLSLNRKDWVARENVGEVSPPRHLDGLSRVEKLELMALVADGNMSAMEAWPWIDGYGS